MVMSLFKRRFLAGILLFCVSLALALLFQYLYVQSGSSSVDVERFSQRVQLNQQKLAERVSQVANEADSVPSKLWNLADSLSDEDYSFLFFRDSTLLAWSDQTLPLKDFNLSALASGMVRLPNGWFLCSRVEGKGFTVAGLFKVKAEYPYENQYIENSFHADLGINGDFSILGSPSDGGIDIEGLNGEYLFSLATGNGLQLYSGKAYASLALLMVAIASLFFLLLHYAKSSRTPKWDFGFAVLLITIFGAVYFIFFVKQWYTATMVCPLFSPIYFAYSEWLSSIGTFFIASLLLFFSSLAFYLLYRQPLMGTRPKRLILFVLSVGAAMLLFWMVNGVLWLLVEHSSENRIVQNIVDLDLISIFKIIIIFLLFFSFALLLDRLIHPFYRKIIPSTQMLGVLVILVLFGTLQWIFLGKINWLGLSFFAIIVVLFLFVPRVYRLSHSYRTYLLLILILSAFVIVQSLVFDFEKEKNNRLFLIETLADKLTGEQDPLAEMYLANVENRIASDLNIREMVGNGEFYEDELRQYLLKNYFYGYLSRFEIQVIPCWPDAELYVEGVNQTFDCYQYFEKMLVEMGSLLYGSTHFYFIKRDNGRVNYFGVFRFVPEGGGRETSIFLEFISKPFYEGLGYPELLLSNKEKSKLDLFNGYSYAKYVDGHLVKRSGNYLYKVTNAKYITATGKDKFFINAGNFSHLVYRPRPGVDIVMSYPRLGVSDVLVSFSVVFIIFFVLVFGFLVIVRLFRSKPFFTTTIQERIQVTMISFVVFLLLVIGVSSVYYSIHQFKKKNNDVLKQRMKSVMLELEHKVGNESVLTPEMAEYLSYLLETFSNVFYSDINLYGLDGKLMATSRGELYQKGITGNLMNTRAYLALAINAEREYMHDESIGSLNYISSYVPFLNRNNEVLAYINLPYFVGTNELREDISSILVAIVNSYLIFVLMAISIAVFASRQITRPLLIIQNRLSQTRLGSKNEKIAYEGADEIGHLVEEYNRMVDELSESAAKLAASEREMAWREMAKQIAHEIKNPLTPMKLSVQYLHNAWKDGVPDFDKYMDRVSKTLIDQINQLSVIANEFSHFAKMPVAKREPVNVVDKLLNTISLYEKSTEVTFRVINHGPGEIIVNTDGEQLLSVFNNLLKNAVQSIVVESEGVVDVELKQLAGDVVISIRDNGKGIPEEIRGKLFTPNFTTKSSGMGLGLAIVKNIVENSGGKIWFETTVGEGSVFHVRLPLV